MMQVLHATAQLRPTAMTHHSSGILDEILMRAPIVRVVGQRQPVNQDNLHDNDNDIFASDRSGQCACQFSCQSQRSRSHPRSTFTTHTGLGRTGRDCGIGLGNGAEGLFEGGGVPRSAPEDVHST